MCPEVLHVNAVRAVNSYKYCFVRLGRSGRLFPHWNNCRTRLLRLKYSVYNSNGPRHATCTEFKLSTAHRLALHPVTSSPTQVRTEIYRGARCAFRYGRRVMMCGDSVGPFCSRPNRLGRMGSSAYHSDSFGVSAYSLLFRSTAPARVRVVCYGYVCIKRPAYLH